VIVKFSWYIFFCFILWRLCFHWFFLHLLNPLLLAFCPFMLKSIIEWSFCILEFSWKELTGTLPPVYLQFCMYICYIYIHRYPGRVTSKRKIHLYFYHIIHNIDMCIMYSYSHHCEEDYFVWLSIPHIFLQLLCKCLVELWSRYMYIIFIWIMN